MKRAPRLSLLLSCAIIALAGLSAFLSITRLVPELLQPVAPTWSDAQSPPEAPFALPPLEVYLDQPGLALFSPGRQWRVPPVPPPAQKTAYEPVMTGSIVMPGLALATLREHGERESRIVRVPDRLAPGSVAWRVDRIGPRSLELVDIEGNRRSLELSRPGVSSGSVE